MQVFENSFCMELTSDQRKFISKSFHKMESKEDLLILINYTKKIIYGEDVRLFEIKHLNYHVNHALNPNRYFQFNILKKSGKLRTIHAPNSGLKSILKCLNLIFNTIHTPHSSAFGFIPGKSIIDNAIQHSNSIYVYNIDLKDFFPTIEQYRVFKRLMSAPFNLNSPKRIRIAGFIASLCCHEMDINIETETGIIESVKKKVLPQGAPTSPIITNMICQNLDNKLFRLARSFGLKYSRYADDITFSSMHNVFQRESDFLVQLNEIILEEGFKVQENKTRLQKSGYRQEVTGLLVNEKPNVNKRYIKQLRMWIYYWENYGYKKANSLFLKSYGGDRGSVKSVKPNMANVIRGKLDYLKMVKGESNAMYKRLRYRFDELLQNTESDIRKYQLNDIIDTIINDDYQLAMNKFNRTIRKTDK